MTRENIARDLKPLEWDIWENGRYCYANINDTYEAMILEKRDGRFLVKINKIGRINSCMITTFDTIAEAQEGVRQWQISHMLSYFKEDKDLDRLATDYILLKS